MAAFDPYQIKPDFQGQSSQVVTAYQQALARMNYQKNSALQQYGFNASGDLSGSGNMYSDGTFANANLSGGLAGVNGISDFAAMDNKSGFGGFRDELNNEANALDKADSGPDRGFSGGLANQAHAAAQQAVNRSQNQFTQGYNQFAGNFNIGAQGAQQQTNQSLQSILGAQAEWGANESLWQSTLPTYTAGISGGGSTPINSPAVAMANSLGYSVNTKQLAAQKPVTFKGTAPAPRGGQAKTVQQK